MTYTIFRSSVLYYILIGGAAALAVSCSDRITGSLFKRPYPHQRYEQQLRSAGMEHSVLYYHWIRAARQSLQQPVEIDIPYQEQAYMAPDKPEATALLFEARHGERLLAELATQSADSARVFLDLFELTADTSNRFRHVQSADTGAISLSYDIPRNGKYLLRIQPELLAAVSYQLRITAGPSLANPVAAGAKQHIGSFFGVARDGGARRHEGIDIFAARLTPVIASADGIISRVGTNNLGGKVVWLRPAGRSFHLYYAHLDSQLVVSGQTVTTGDTLGLMGNTGNARTTPPHLHFGIYTSGGAVDPLPFVRPEKSVPPKIVADARQLGDTVRALVEREAFMAQTPVLVEAVLQNGYRVVLPDRSKHFLLHKEVSRLSRPIQTHTLTEPQFLLHEPDPHSARIAEIPAGTRLRALGMYGGYYLVDAPRPGWLHAADLSK